MSPALHWIHHSINPNHYDKNLGMKFPFWDKLFGTYLDESHLKDIHAYGVENITNIILIRTTFFLGEKYLNV